MALDFKKIGDVELLEQVPDTANVVVEVDSAFKRVPGSNLGGGGIKTAVIHIDLGMDEGEPSSLTKSSAGVSTPADNSSAAPSIYTATCENMTFEEAKAILSAHHPLSVMMDFIESGNYICSPAAFVGHISDVDVIAIQPGEPAGTELFYWTADGISTQAPEELK